MPRTRIQIPGGQVKWVTLDRGQRASLAGNLESQGIRLNMRCGGRGLCNGCRVEYQSSGSCHAIKACQQDMASLPGSINCIRIPENSWRDHSLHGVSVFEVHGDHAFDRLGKSGFGIALDIGTTTLAGALWDFATGACLSHLSLPNPQSRFGDNVLSRINFAIENENGAAALQTILVRDGLLPLVRQLCQSASTRQRDVTCATVSGNPTMLHTLLGEDLSGFSKYPFKPVFLDERCVNSRDLGFFNAFEMQILPSLGPFVGADIVAGAIASGMLDGPSTLLLIDFGTNGEILLKKGQHYLATATAAGPAFEGGRLNCGAIARSGVISSLKWIDQQWKCKLMGGQDGRALGLSGAAYVDFLADGCANGLLDNFGRFNRSFPGVYERRHGEDRDWRIDLADSIFITESDVAELLQAKAAIGGGILTLMDHAGVSATDLERVIVAGGFGYHLDPQHAIETGLLPKVDANRVQMVGNGSLGGASLLLNFRADEHIRGLLSACEVIELNQMEKFEDYFTDCLMLQEIEDQ